MTTTIADFDLMAVIDALPQIQPGSDAYFEYPYEFHYGMPSRPICIYHTGDSWQRPTGPEAYGVPKEARPIFTHPIAPVWREVGQQVYEYFDSINLKWTTIDFVRFGEVKKEAGPPFIWVGVLPETLSREDAKNAAAKCKQMLAEYQITDVEIAFRESIFTRSAGPRLLKSDRFYHPLIHPPVNVRDPFTPTLGVPISPKDFSHFGGTGGLYLREGGERNRVFLLTARHVVLPPSEYHDELYECKDTNISPGPCREVIHLGNKAFQNALQSIKDMIYDEQEQLNDDDGIAEAQRSIGILEKLYTEITRFWTLEKDRILGYVIHSPPIYGDTGDKCFTEDWALIELYDEKIDWNSFRGNVMFLGTRERHFKYNTQKHPLYNIKSFDFPLDGLLQLQDVVKEDELHKPTVLDATGVESFFVIKNGGTTGLTIGRTTGFDSFVREYDNNIIRSTSVMMAIHQYSHEEGTFSTPGDSGSVIADINGRIAGILTGGAGKEGDYDVSYAMPYYWLEERIKVAFPDSQLYPIIPRNHT